eukprot:gene11388-12574_t
MGCGSSRNSVKVVITGPSSIVDNTNANKALVVNNEVSKRNSDALSSWSDQRQNDKRNISSKAAGQNESNDVTNNVDNGLVAVSPVKEKSSPKDETVAKSDPHSPRNNNNNTNVTHFVAEPQSRPNSSNRRSKTQLFASVNIFRDVDLYALEAPNGCKESFGALSNYLTGPYDSELMKFRAIWKWVTANIEYDTEQFFNPHTATVASGGTNDILKSGKGVCDGYASVVLELCRCAGIKIHKITGHAKGFRYRPGDRIKGTKTNHAWNAVKIENQWWLCDFTWGAGYVGNDKRFVWNYTEHYFLTDPEDFVLDHFPADDEWQLLKSCYTIEEFEKWAKFYKHFFIYELKPLAHRDGVISAENGAVEVALKTTGVPVNVICKLNSLSEGKTKDKSEYCFCYQVGNKAVFQAHLPEVGDYGLNLFAQKTSDTGKSYDSVAHYIIRCEKAMQNCQVFPKTFNSWTSGYILHDPTRGILPPHQKILFKITAPSVVTDMAACVTGGDGEWLTLSLNSEGFWTGEFSFSENAKLVSVVVKLDGQTSTTYSSILKYTIQA